MNITAVGVISVANLIMVVINILNGASVFHARQKAPLDAEFAEIKEKLIKLESRINEHDKRLEDSERHLDNDRERLEELERGNKVFSKAMLAMLGHLNSGDNLQEMRTAEQDLRDYLIER